MNAVKAKLLAKNEQMLVVSAIAGLGGLGKSVLAAALILDLEVQERFADGILWVTLGQNPDLQTMLGDWIRELDKSRDAFSANTLEAASRYLHNLLIERRMLLVVDDVWNATHAEWFRVGGVGCRVLVTTREAQLEGAEYYSLDLMTENEAVDLVRQKLKHVWRPEEEHKVRDFAKVLGYLPLALDLATNQVRHGLSWADLKAEFEAERRAVALGAGRRSRAITLLDSLEAWDRLDENEQRNYSLQACFNLSLNRLNKLQLKQFAWLGVLPEDVIITGTTAAVLWDVPLIQAKRILALLRTRSFLTDGVVTFENELTYRVHDLMHDIARCLIEEDTLQVKSLDLESKNCFQIAHCHFLDRYRNLAAYGLWEKLPNDGYIHRHLTWHMVQAGLNDELHQLMSASNEYGRNAWFEACEQVGQPAIFVDDVSRGWKLAEEEYYNQPSKSLILQCRYALVTASLHSLVEQVPANLMSEFMMRGYWTPEQTWAYVEQIQDDQRVSEAIVALAPSLPEYILNLAVKKAHLIQNKYRKALALSSLAQIKHSIFPDASRAVDEIRDEYCRAFVLCTLTQISGISFTQRQKLSEIASSFQNKEYQRRALNCLNSIRKTDSSCTQESSPEFNLFKNFSTPDTDFASSSFKFLLKQAKETDFGYPRACLLSALAKHEDADFTQLLEVARSIRDENEFAYTLSKLAKLNHIYFEEAFRATKLITDSYRYKHIFRALSQVQGADFTRLFETAQKISNFSDRSDVLCELARMESASFMQLLEAAQKISNFSDRSDLLCELTHMKSADYTVLLKTTQELFKETVFSKKQNRQPSSYLNRIFRTLAKMKSANFYQLLKLAQKLPAADRGEMICALAQMESADFNQLLKLAREIPAADRGEMICALAQMESADFSQLLELAREIPAADRGEMICALAQMEPADFNQLLELAREIPAAKHSDVLCALSQMEFADINQLKKAAKRRKISDPELFLFLARLKSEDFNRLLATAQNALNLSDHPEVLCALSQMESADFSQLLKLARKIPASRCREVLCSLARMESADFSQLLKLAQKISNPYDYCKVLSALSDLNSANFTQLLRAAQNLQDERELSNLLVQLAKKEAVNFIDLLESIKLIQDEMIRANVLIEIACRVSSSLLDKAFQVVDSITHRPTGAKVISSLIACPTNVIKTYADWQFSLNLLSCRKRSELMQDIVSLHYVITYFSGEETMNGIVDAMREVCDQWK
ncbi:hypothetical protein C8B47_11845 [filamentous cyanobacterium CCP4]|nr:hypothetical protein C8B47_11845 [filamentous cyanobacterium CCP4]